MDLDDATINRRPAARETVALRDSVLDGTLLGRAKEATRASAAEFLTERFPYLRDWEALAVWFGNDHVPRSAAALRGALDRDIAAIDALISEQLDAILHHPALRRLEGRWRGLAWLLDGTETGSRVKVKLLDITWPEICRDLERAAEFDQSQLFRKVYEDEFGTPGGEPYGLLIIDHEVRHRMSAEARTDDVTAITSLAGVAAASFAPVVMGASPTLLEVDTFTDLATVTDIAAALRNVDHARWRSLSSRPDMRFVGVVLPRVLAREPWQDDGTRADRFRYAEYAPGAEQRVWMSAIYPFAAVVARAFANFAWPADVRGVETDREGGGLVEHVAIEPFHTDPDHVWPKVSLDIVWTDKQERELRNGGLLPLSSIPNSEELVFGAARSLQMPQRFTGATAAIADANARLSAQINSLLCVSRFAHCLKMLGRQMVGSFKTEHEIQANLQDWLNHYVNRNTSAGGDSRARFPLVAGRIEVQEQTGKPGSFGCVAHLQPHYQLDDVSATFQIVADLGRR